MRNDEKDIKVTEELIERGILNDKQISSITKVPIDQVQNIRNDMKQD